MRDEELTELQHADSRALRNPIRRIDTKRDPERPATIQPSRLQAEEGSSASMIHAYAY